MEEKKQAKKPKYWASDIKNIIRDTTMEEKKQDTSRSNPPPLSGETPWLVYTHGASSSKRKQCQIFTSMSPLPRNNKSYVKSIPAMQGKSIRGSYNGWLILVRHGQNNCIMFTLFNPVTSQSIELPEFQYELSLEDEGTHYMLISTPDLDECVFMVFDLEKVFFCRPARGDSTWVKQTLEVDGKTVCVCRAAVLDRVVYGFVLNTIVDEPEVQTVASIELDYASNSLIVRSLQSGWPDCCMHWTTRHLGLVESCGAIYCVGRFRSHGSHGRDHRYSMVKVWTLDLKKQNWMEVNSLDGRAFFLGKDSCCTWCWGSSEGASDGVPGNCVYYYSEDTRHRNNEAVYCYKLHDNSTMLLHVCLTLINLCTSLVWLKPLHDSGENRLLEKQGKKEAMKRAETLNQAAISTVVGDEELQQQNGMQDSLLNQLHVDLLNEISKKLQLFDRLNRQATCKLFRSLDGPDQNSLPQFVFFKDDYKSSTVLDPFEPSYSSSISLKPSQEPFTIDFSKNGWLLITVHPLRSRQYFNPFRRQQGKYPHLCELEAVKSIGFSTYPTSSDCVTVGLYDSLNIINVYYHQYGDEAWKKCRIVNKDFIFTPVTSGPLYYEGAFYILSKDGHLGEIRLADGDKSWEIHNKPQTNESKDYNLHTSCHLLECNGQLYSVYLGYYGKWVDVFRFNTSKKTWVKVQNIGKYCFFLSHLSSISAETYSATGIRNRIYLPRFRGKNEMLYYCLETCKYGVSGSDDTLEDIFNTTEPLNYCWI